MKLHTSSEIISLAKKLETDSAKFYQELSQDSLELKDILLSYAKENYKNTAFLERVYYGVISDAIEGCFAFDMESDDYSVTLEMKENDKYSDVLRSALRIEKVIGLFYLESARQSQSLMADITLALTTLGKKRNTRQESLNLLIEKNSKP